MNGPWANWDDTLEGQSVYFSVEEYPDQKKATEELRGFLIDGGEEDLTPGRAKKAKVKVCGSDCAERCEDASHQIEMECWIYQPRRKAERKPGGPPLIMRCSHCRLLCQTSRRTGKTYVHGIWSNAYGKIIRCPGAQQAALDPKTSTGPSQ